MQRFRPLALALLFTLPVAAPGCAGDPLFRTVHLSEVYGWLAPYDGFNLEMNFFTLNLAQSVGFGPGLEVVEFNIFHEWAFGGYGRVGMPAFGARDDNGYHMGWVPGGGFIYQPVITPKLRAYLKLGVVGQMWNQDMGGGSSTAFWAPGFEAAIGMALGYFYRPYVDFYISKGFAPDAEVDPLVFALRINVVGFSMVQFK